jgi:RNA polymerase sigma-70 factor, ECF subfamily
MHRALRRLRLRGRNEQLDDSLYDDKGSMSIAETSPDPEQRASTAELGQTLEEAVLGLPNKYRTAFMLRDIEEVTTSETAAALDLTEQNMKVRLHRGRAMLRDWLFARLAGDDKGHFHS